MESNAASTSSLWYAKYLETYPVSGSFNSTYEISYSDEEPPAKKKNKKKTKQKEQPSKGIKKISDKKQIDTAAQTDPQISDKKQINTAAQTDLQISDKIQIDSVAQTDPQSSDAKKQVEESSQTDAPPSAQNQRISPEPAIENEPSTCEHICTMMEFPASPVQSGTLLLVGRYVHSSDLFCLVLDPELTHLLPRRNVNVANRFYIVCEKHCSAAHSCGSCGNDVHAMCGGNITSRLCHNKQDIMEHSLPTSAVRMLMLLLYVMPA